MYRAEHRARSNPLIISDPTTISNPTSIANPTTHLKSRSKTGFRKKATSVGLGKRKFTRVIARKELSEEEEEADPGATPLMPYLNISRIDKFVDRRTSPRLKRIDPCAEEKFDIVSNVVPNRWLTRASVTGTSHISMIEEPSILPKIEPELMSDISQDSDLLPLATEWVVSTITPNLLEYPSKDSGDTRGDQFEYESLLSSSQREVGCSERNGDMEDQNGLEYVVSSFSVSELDSSVAPKHKFSTELGVESNCNDFQTLGMVGRLVKLVNETPPPWSSDYLLTRAREMFPDVELTMLKAAILCIVSGSRMCATRIMNSSARNRRLTPLVRCNKIHLDEHLTQSYMDSM